MSYEFIRTETRGRVAVITLDRPEALNALNTPLMGELACALSGYESDPAVGAVLLSGSEKAFAAGADIREMADQDYQSITEANHFAETHTVVERFRKPIIAAVSGYALGGGCELALMCDSIVASETARFGQPEISIGTVPAMGGTQRLMRSIGKAKTMDLCLTGRMMKADEAERCGLVARVVPADRLMEEALEMAEAMASFSIPVSRLVKAAVLTAAETTQKEGLLQERNHFYASFALEDRREGMKAFSEKRKPVWKHR